MRGVDSGVGGLYLKSTFGRVLLKSEGDKGGRRPRQCDSELRHIVLSRTRCVQHKHAVQMVKQQVSKIYKHSEYCPWIQLYLDFGLCHRSQ